MSPLVLVRITHLSKLTILMAALLGLLTTGCSDAPSDGPSGTDAGADAASDVATAGDASGGDGGVGDGVATGDGASGGGDTSAKSCPPGLAGCVEGDRVVCNDTGTAFAIVPCAAETVCSAGKCVACASDADCATGEVCTEAVCATPQLTITTEALPTAQVGQAYSQPLAAAGGVPPYTWKLDQGLLPAGILVGSTGEVKGVATEKAVASVSISVTDDKGKTASRIFVFEVKAGGGLVISTTSPLKKATEGKSYSLQLEAKGGEKPYFWGLKSGKLPNGVTLGADGQISGTPTEDGTFTFDIKVLDDGAPTLTATRSFELPIGLAPLEIVGLQEVNLFVTKVIVLPLIIVVKSVPVPYSNQLAAKGGKKPYAWSEVALPAGVKSFIPNSGLPKGLTLGKDGKISGSVTDPSLVVEVKIPLTQIVLKGFFFAAKVTDSQGKPQSKTAMFIIPTAPVNF